MKKSYDVIAFDLDGTLTNPERGQLSGFEYAFKKHKINYPIREYLKRYIGPPIHIEWREHYNLTEAETVEMIETYREYYNVYGWWDNELYEGITEMLSALRAQNKKIVLATSKPELIARKIVTHFGLDKYFDFMGGATEDDKRHQKKDVLEYSLASVNCTDKSKAVLVGDRKYDAEGARLVGIDSVGVLWGHGSYEELSSEDFVYIAKTTKDLLDYLI